MGGGLAKGAAVTLAYALLGIIGLEAASFGQQVSLLWLPSGVALGALFILGPAAWPAVWLGSLLANLAAGTPPLTCALIASGSALAAAVGARWLRASGLDPHLGSLAEVQRFATRGVAPTAAIAATAGSLSLLAGDQAAVADLPAVWLTWLMGDAVGALVGAPLVFALATGAWAVLLRPTWPGMLLAPAGLLGAAVGFLSQGGTSAVGAGASVFGVVATAAVYGLPVSSVLAVMLTLLAQVGVVRGTGLFAALGSDAPVYTWAYMALVAVTAITVASVQAERVEAQRRDAVLQAAALKAQRLEALGVIAAGVAHDFNNILQVISGYADLARKEAADTAALDRIQASVQRGARLCDQLEAYAGLVPSQPRPITLGAELAGLAPLLAAGLPDGVRLEVDAPAPGPATVIDPALLDQVVAAIVRNAVEAVHDAGGGEVHVHTGHGELRQADLDGAAVVSEASRPGAHCWVEVQDDGAGMSDETRRRLFEPFYTTRFLGRGLGMAAVAGLVSSQGGAVFVQSAPGSGTVVRVAWPSPASPDPSTAAPGPPDGADAA